MPSRLTLAHPCEHEIDRIKGSRFIGHAAPFDGIDAAKAFIDALWARYPDARHVCYAWRTADHPPQIRLADDGEPSGTGGRPILQALEGRELTGVVVGVVRYFGGVKLGTGGLTRAYGQATAAVLDAAEIHEAVEQVTLTFTYDYGLTGPVQGALTALSLTPEASDYGTEVAQSVSIPVETVEAVEAALVEATSGRVQLSRSAPRYA